MTVVVTAVFYPKPGKKQELDQAMQRGSAAVHEVKGCELYAIHDAEDGTITKLEKWTTHEDLDAHRAGEPVQTLNADIAEQIEQPTLVTRMTPIRGGTEAQAPL